jgi:hypothetical protein
MAPRLPGGRLDGILTRANTDTLVPFIHAALARDVMDPEVYTRERSPEPSFSNVAA